MLYLSNAAGQTSIAGEFVCVRASRKLEESGKSKEWAWRKQEIRRGRVKMRKCKMRAMGIMHPLNGPLFRNYPGEPVPKM